MLLIGLDRCHTGSGLRTPGREPLDGMGLIEALPLWRDLFRRDAEYRVTLKQMMNKCCKTSVYVRYPLMFTDTDQGDSLEMSVPLQVSYRPVMVVLVVCLLVNARSCLCSLHVTDWRGHGYSGTDASQKMTPKCRLSFKCILFNPVSDL